MAMLPTMRRGQALVVGLIVGGALLVPAPAIAAPTTIDMAAFEDPPPPPPSGPGPDAQPPANPGPAPVGPAPRRHHIDGDPIIER